MPHADRIIQIMSESDIDDSQRCDCGLPADKSSLPRGWSVHLSQDVESFGEVSLIIAFCYFESKQ